MVRVSYLLAIENVDNKSVYKIDAKITSEDMKTEYKTITKEITFDEFNLQVKYTQEELDLKSRVEEIVKKALFTTAASILNNEVVGEVAVIESGLGDKMQSGLNINSALTAVLVNNTASEYKRIDYSCVDINKAEEPSWIVFPWEDWWKN
jgi:hypothetical protein